jgi:hypothetical protein
MLELTAQQKFSQSLREIADFYDQHPEIKTPSLCEMSIFGADKDQIALGAKAFGKAEKKFEGDNFCLIKTFPSGMKLEYFANRERVCERVKVGEEVIPAHVIPAREETIVAEKVKDVFEWRCGSIFGGENSQLSAPVTEVVDDIPF